jgi:hypothetical protein
LNGGATSDPATEKAAKVVKQFGLQRTGTNYLLQLLKANYKVEVLTNGGGWKHGRYKVPQILGHEVDCVCMVKHPLAWLDSMFRYEGLGPYSYQKFERYVRRGTLVEHWNHAYSNWLDAAAKMKKCKMVFLRYDKLLAHPKESCGIMADLLDLERRDRPFKGRFNRMANDGTISKKKFKRKYWIAKEYLKHYRPPLVEFVMGMIDKELLGAFGYA